MRQAPFMAMAGATAALGTVLAFFALQLRASGYEPYVESVTTFSMLMFATSALVVATWARDGRRRSD
ncbi:SCO3870 family protein [Streptomyces sp. BH106]|uniref:SCO3870 family protein n=1 Tax=Streptomyces sp. BH106 TaxID=3410409 RepID=UPI003CF73B02